MRDGDHATISRHLAGIKKLTPAVAPCGCVDYGAQTKKPAASGKTKPQARNVPVNQSHNTPETGQRKMTDEKKDDEQETVTIGPLRATLSRENMRTIMPYVGISLIITTVALAIGAVVWGIK